MKSIRAKENLAAVRELADPCRICPRKCGARRMHGEVGLCGAGLTPRLFMEYVHWGEDADIDPAHTLYLSGCNLSCGFCQTGWEQKLLPGVALTVEGFARILARGLAEGARTVDILGGEPTVNMPGLFALFAASEDFDGLVWNTNLYGESEAFRLLDGVVDIYLGDIKFGNRECAARLAGIPDASDVARQRALEIMARSPDALIVRHLALPGHYDCCAKPVLEWIAANLPGVRVSLKTGYMPPKDMDRTWPEYRVLSCEETAKVRALAERLGLALTQDAPLSVGTRTAGREGGAVDVEVTISPEGVMYFRHITRDVAEAIQAVYRPENEL